MDKARVTKFVVKAAIGVTVSASIGTMIKSQKSLDTLIDQYFGNKTETS